MRREINEQNEKIKKGKLRNILSATVLEKLATA